MTRKYVKWANISENSRNAVIQSVKLGTLTFQEGAAKLGIHESTLWRHVRGKVGLQKDDDRQGGKKAGQKASVTAKAQGLKGIVQEVLGTNRVLNKGLRPRNLVMHQPNGQYFEYYPKQKLVEGKVYYCLGCYSIKKSGSGPIAKVIVTSDGKVRNYEKKHRANCQTISGEKILAREMERKARKRCKEGLQLPYEAYKNGRIECYDVCEKFGLPMAGKGSLPILYPPWFKVSPQFYKLRQGAHYGSMKNPFKEIDSSPFVHTYVGERSGSSDRWLLAKSEVEGVMLFMSNKDLKVFCESELSVGDATFKSAPRGFYQEYKIISHYKGEWCKVATAVMTNKAQASYEFLYSAIVAGAKAQGLSYKGTYFLTDFEAAEFSAAKKYFGPQVVKGCLFHFTKIILRDVAQGGLWRYYSKQFGKRNVIYEWVRKVIALPLLPTKLVEYVWELFLKNPPQAPSGWVPPAGFTCWPDKLLKEFAEKFEKNWIKSKAHPIEFWNHFESGSTRTTNAAEADNSAEARRSNALVHPDLSHFLSRRQESHAFQEARFEQLEIGFDPRPKDKKYVKLDGKLAQYKKRLFNVYQSWQSSALPPSSFIVQEASQYLTRCAFLLAETNEVGVPMKQVKLKAAAKIVSRAVKGSLKGRKRTKRIRPLFPTSKQPPVQGQQARGNAGGNPILLPWSTSRFSNTCPTDNGLFMLLNECQFNRNFLGVLKKDPSKGANALVACLEGILNGGSQNNFRNKFYDFIVAESGTAKHSRFKIAPNPAGGKISLWGNESDIFFRYLDGSGDMKFNQTCPNPFCPNPNGRNWTMDNLTLLPFESMLGIKKDTCNAILPPGITDAMLQGYPFKKFRQVVSVAASKLLTPIKKKCQCDIEVKCSFTKSSPWLLSVTVMGKAADECLQLPSDIKLDGRDFKLKGFTVFASNHYTAVISQAGKNFYFDAMTNPITFSPLSPADLKGKTAGTAVYLLKI